MLMRLVMFAAFFVMTTSFVYAEAVGQMSEEELRKMCCQADSGIANSSAICNQWAMQKIAEAKGGRINPGKVDSATPGK